MHCGIHSARAVVSSIKMTYRFHQFEGEHRCAPTTSSFARLFLAHVVFECDSNGRRRFLGAPWISRGFPRRKKPA
jgi:hypothetical protein